MMSESSFTAVDRPAPNQSVKVLLIEDSFVLAERMADDLREIPEIQLVGTVDSEIEAIAAMNRQRIDVVLMDLQLRQGTGFGVLRAIGTMQHKPKIVILTNHDLPEYKSAAAELGVAHFLDKARDFARLPAVLRDVLGGTVAR
ncbi:MAG: response regulator [Pseudomonadota bacterium]|nr:response regulator [Pseudomonadota bacterium]